MVDHFDINQYGSCYPRHLYDNGDVHTTDMYLNIEQQLIQLEERRLVEQLKQQEEQQRHAIQFQRAGFQSSQQPKRKRPSGWQ